MKAGLEIPAAEYIAALREYLATGSEAALSTAYEFGRRVVEGGILDLTSLHHQALAAIAKDPDYAIRAQLDKAAIFFTEVVSPLEMALRSYKEMTAALLEMNSILERQNDELGHAKKAADAANKELEAFSYSVAHDLRAPLRSIDGFSQALLEDYDALLDEEGQRYLRNVRESAQEMGHLIDDLLRLSRVSRAEIKYKRVSLTTLVNAIVERLRHAHPHRSVVVDVEPNLEIVGDSRLLGIAFENLLANAWKFTRDRSDARIAVGCLAETERVYFVRDNGAGFDPTYAHKLFGVFQRLHSDAEFEGTGIGLATVQRIVLRHGGRIWAEGAVDQGATFFLTLSEGKA